MVKTRPKEGSIGIPQPTLTSPSLIKIFLLACTSWLDGRICAELCDILFDRARNKEKMLDIVIISCSV
uniref:Uncharacterized protein n=1 Tax=Picea glauca TaxID=3330 RepID=A0A101M5V4_PICGL|nr:hypothetical protein ABT39_MTgene1207 [Picea glauca]QHR86716.1 hypothetical protein Q903MT_gene720 [Picea sitchensis]